MGTETTVRREKKPLGCKRTVGIQKQRLGYRNTFYDKEKDGWDTQNTVRIEKQQLGYRNNV